MSAATDPVTPQQAVSTTPTNTIPTTSTTPTGQSQVVDLTSMAAFQKSAPQVYQAILQGIAMAQIQYMQDAEATREQLDQESQNI